MHIVERKMLISIVLKNNKMYYVKEKGLPFSASFYLINNIKLMNGP